MSNILIEANSISKIYDPDILFKRGTNFYALNKVNFILQEGDFVSIMGPSGSGKSTLVNCISTLDEVTKGTVKINGKVVSTLNDTQLSTFRYEQLGFVFQNHNLIPSLTIYDNIASPVMLGNLSPKEINKRIEDLAERLSIKRILAKRPGECSGGEKQRAAIARALINHPKIIVCDEPTGNLDSTNSHEVLNILSDLNKTGISVIVVTHDAMIASYAKTLMYLRDGEIQTVVHRGDAKQIDFYNEIVKISVQDSLVKLFNKEDSSENKVNFEKDTLVRKENIDNSMKTRRNQVFAELENDHFTDTDYDNVKRLEVTNTDMIYSSITKGKSQIHLADIDKVSLSLKPVYRSFGIFSEYQFYVLLDITIKEDSEYFTLVNVNDLSPLFKLLKENAKVFEDPIGIEEIYQKYTDHLVRTRYLQKEMGNLKKKFGIGIESKIQ
jgi:ABC-type lipoprotein export system ATPase subunit